MITDRLTHLAICDSDIFESIARRLHSPPALVAVAIRNRDDIDNVGPLLDIARVTCNTSYIRALFTW